MTNSHYRKKNNTTENRARFGRNVNLELWFCRSVQISHVKMNNRNSQGVLLNCLGCVEGVMHMSPTSFFDDMIEEVAKVFVPSIQNGQETEISCI